MRRLTTTAVAALFMLTLTACGASRYATVDTDTEAPDAAPERDTVALHVAGDVPDLGEGATPLVLRLEGCCANTQGEELFAALTGDDIVDVVPGKYYVTWISPTGIDGSLCVTPSEEKVIVIDETHNEARIESGAASVETETDGRLVWTELEIPSLTKLSGSSAAAVTERAKTLDALAASISAKGAYGEIAQDIFDAASKNLGYGGVSADGGEDVGE